MKRIWHWNRESTLTISGGRHLREKTTQTNEIYLWAPKCGAVVNLGAMQIYIYVFSMKKDNFHASHFYYWHSILLIVVCCLRLIRGAQYRANRTEQNTESTLVSGLLLHFFFFYSIVKFRGFSPGRKAIFSG